MSVVGKDIAHEAATTHVSAVNPYTPHALNVFRSACAPAPALQSEPAIVRATGIAPFAGMGIDALRLSR